MELVSQPRKFKVPRDLSKKILLINHDQYEVDQIMYFLSNLGLEDPQEIVTLCKSGMEALKLIQDRENRSAYKLVLMECNMPVMSGMETALKMQEFLHEVGVSTAQQPQIYGFTCQYNKQIAQRASVCGMKGVFSKPVQQKVLAQLLYKLRFIDDIQNI